MRMFRRVSHTIISSFHCCLFRIVSIATVFVNKSLLSGQSVHLEAPLFITWFQCIISFIICFTLSSTGGISGVFNFPKGTPWCRDVARNVSS